MTEWNARSAADLAGISSLLHDAYFDFDDVAHDAVARVLSVPFAQERAGLPVDDDPAWRDAPRVDVVRKTWRYTEQRVPFVRGVLRVRQVESVALDAEAGDAATLLGLDYDETSRRLKVEGVSGDLIAVVARIDLTAELRPDEVALYVRRRRGRLGASDVPLFDE